jgi:hypothetical protein
LKAQGAWDEIAHDVKLRREILKMRASRRLNFTVNHEFIERFIKEKQAKEKTSRRAATDLARTMRVLAHAPIETTFAGELLDAAGSSSADGSGADSPGAVAGGRKEGREAGAATGMV